MMRKRLQIGKLLKGDKRLEGETFVEYKERLKLEKSLLNDYGKGVYISKNFPIRLEVIEFLNSFMMKLAESYLNLTFQK